MIVDPDTPQPKPLTGMPVPGIKTSDQIVSEIHGAMANLPPEHQAALDHGISVLKGSPSGASEAPPIPPGATPTATRGYYVENGAPYQSSPDSTAQHGASAALDEPVDSSIRFDGQPNFTPVAAQSGDSSAATPPMRSLFHYDGDAWPQKKFAVRGEEIAGLDKATKDAFGGGPSSDPSSARSLFRYDGDPLPAKEFAVRGHDSASDLDARTSAALGGGSGLPGMVAANQPEIALPTKRSLSGRMSLLESPSMIGPKVGAYQPIPSPSSPAATELKRLRDTGSGVSQIHNPFLKTLGTVADVIGSGMFPQFAQFVPGSSAHHEQLISGKEAQVGDEQKQRKLDEEAQKSADESETAETNRKHLQSQADELASRPELKKAQNDLKAEHEENDRQRKTEAADASLRQHGFKRDEKTGQIVALSPEELSGPQRDIHDAKAAQQELMSARAELVRAQQAHIPAAEALARRRLDSAQASHDIALERLGLSEKTFEARYHGTEGGAALPGAMIADNGQTVGTAFQQNVRPTGAERNKADLANSAAEQISDIKNIVKKRHDIFGPINGRTTDFSVWLGSQDPDAQRFRAARTIAGDHLAGVFGGRSETALHALDDAIGRFKDNPEAVEAGLDQVVKGNEVFQKAGTVKTAGSSAAGGKDAAPTVTNKAQYDALPKGATYMEDGKKYRKP